RKRCAIDRGGEALAADFLHDQIGVRRIVAHRDDARRARSFDHRKDRFLDFEAHDAERGLAAADARPLHDHRKSGILSAGRLHAIDIAVAAGVEQALDREATEDVAGSEAHMPVSTRYASASGRPAARILAADAAWSYVTRKKVISRFDSSKT